MELCRSDLDICEQTENVYCSVVRKLLAHKNFKIHQQNKDGDTIFHHILRHKFMKLSHMLIQNLKTVNIQDKDGNSPLHYTCQHGDIIATEMLLIAKCDITLKNKNDETALMLLYDTDIAGNCDPKTAESYGNLVTLLLNRRKFKINQRSQSRNTILHHACKNGFASAVNALVRHENCPVNVKNNSDDTALMVVAQTEESSSKIQIMNTLLSHGKLNPNLQNLNGDTSLHLSCTRGRTRFVENLLRNDRCDINITNDVGDTPLMAAARFSQLSTGNIIKLLLQHPSVDVNKQDDNGDSVLHHASKHGFLASDETMARDIRSPEVQNIVEAAKNTIKILLNHETLDVNKRNTRKETALHQACMYGYLDSAEVLIAHDKCDVNAQNLNGDTAMLMLCSLDIQMNNVVKQKLRNIISSLIYDQHVDINYQNQQGNNALLLACGNVLTAIVDVLVHDTSCNINSKNYRGQSVLHMLSQRLTSGKDFQNALLLVKEIQASILKASNEVKPGDDLQINVLELYLRQATDFHEFRWSENSKEDIRLLIQSGESINASKKSFALAVNRNSLELCRELLNMGAFVNSTLYDNESALHCAVRLNSLRKTELILDNNPNLTMRFNGMTPLEFAISNGCQPQILELLSKNVSMEEVEASISSSCIVGETPLMCAVRLGVQKWVSYFELNPPIVNEEDRSLSIDDIPSVWYDSRRKCSPKITLRHTGLNQKNSKEVNLDTVLNSRANFIHHKTEVEEIVRTIFRLLYDVSEDISSNNESNFLAFEPLLAGSMAEDTKCFFPDELDILCVFKHTEDLKFEHRSGDIFRIAKHNNSKWKPLAVGLYLEQGKVASALYKRIALALRNVVARGLTYGKLYLFHQSLLLGDKISKLQLLWRGTAFKDMTIYVDLVPAFLLTGHKLACVTPFNVTCDQHFVIAKKSRHEQDLIDVDFRVSYSTVERAVIHSLSENMKLGLIAAKAVRIASISRPSTLYTTFIPNRQPPRRRRRPPPPVPTNLSASWLKNAPIDPSDIEAVDQIRKQGQRRRRHRPSKRVRRKIRLKRADENRVKTVGHEGTKNPIQALPSYSAKNHDDSDEEVYPALRRLLARKAAKIRPLIKWRQSAPPRPMPSDDEEEYDELPETQPLKLIPENSERNIVPKCRELPPQTVEGNDVTDESDQSEDTLVILGDSDSTCGHDSAPSLNDAHKESETSLPQPPHAKRRTAPPTPSDEEYDELPQPKPQLKPVQRNLEHFDSSVPETTSIQRAFQESAPHFQYNYSSNVDTGEKEFEENQPKSSRSWYAGYERENLDLKFNPIDPVQIELPHREHDGPPPLPPRQPPPRPPSGPSPSSPFPSQPTNCSTNVDTGLKMDLDLFEELTFLADNTNCEVQEDFRSEDFVTSYLLKTCLFRILLRNPKLAELTSDDIKSKVEGEEYEGTHESYDGYRVPGELLDNTVYGWAHAIYAELQACLEKKAVPSWNYGEKEYLLYCQDCATERGCCYKRHLMLEMVKSIRRWLVANRRDLLRYTFTGYEHDNESTKDIIEVPSQESEEYY